MKLDDVKLGQTIVKVIKKEINENGRESSHEIHRGVVVQDLGNWIRVFNPEPPEKGGDYDPICSELFPVHSKRVHVEKTGELKDNQAIKVPVQFN